MLVSYHKVKVTTDCLSTVLMMPVALRCQMLFLVGHILPTVLFRPRSTPELCSLIPIVRPSKLSLKFLNDSLMEQDTPCQANQKHFPVECCDSSKRLMLKTQFFKINFFGKSPQIHTC